MKKWAVLAVGATFIFSFNMNVLADEGHSHDKNVKKAAEAFRNGTSTDHESSGTHETSGHDDGSGNHETEGTHDMDGMEMDDMDMSGDDHSGHDSEGTHDMDGMEMDDKDMSDHDKGSHETGSKDHEEGSEGHGESGTHEEGGHGATDKAVDNSPNGKVLGAFGAINLSFILIGVWNKWLRRKGE